MTAEVKGTQKRCKRLLELPLVVSEWQQQAYCPDCDHYCDGQCERGAGEAGCPFEGGELPLREVTATPDEELSAVREVEPCSAADRPSLGASTFPGTACCGHASLSDG